MEGLPTSFLLQLCLASYTLQLSFDPEHLGVPHDPNEIHFYLYSSPSYPNSSYEIHFNDSTSLTRSPFQKNVKTVFLIHGFTNSADSHFPSVVKDAYLNSTLNYNYIIVDWSYLATSASIKFLTIVNDATMAPFYFIIVRKNIPIVAKRVADFVEMLLQNNFATLASIHIVGHSLGAHVAGTVGNLISNEYKGTKIARISGLDPAGPLFENVEVQRKLTSEDANFVDVYHTSIFGTFSSLGQIDFYPNGGLNQPNCGNIVAGGSCSHTFVADIYAASISRNFTACECSLGKFNLKDSIGKCPNPTLVGEPCPTSARGHYYFKFVNNS